MIAAFLVGLALPLVLFLLGLGLLALRKSRQEVSIQQARYRFIRR